MMIEVAVHPQFLLSLTDQLKRIDGLEDEWKKETRSIGVTLGSFDLSKDVSSLFLGIELTNDDKSGLDGMKSKLNLLNEIYGNKYLTVVGLYSVFNNDSIDKTHKEDIVQLAQYIKVLANERERLGVLKEFDNDLFTISEYIGEKVGFDLKIYNSDGEECKWTVKSTDSEETMLNTFKVGKLDESTSSSINDFKTSLKSMNDNLAIMIKFIKKVKSGTIDLSEKRTRQEVTNIIQLVNKIQLAKEAEQLEDNNNELEQMTSLVSISTNLIKDNLILSSELREMISNSINNKDQIQTPVGIHLID